jgi:hypothetical protein
MVATSEDASTHLWTAGHTVNPGDRVAIVIVTTQHGVHHAIEIIEALRIDSDVARGDWDHLQGGLRDDTGQAHSSGSCPK